MQILNSGPIFEVLSCMKTNLSKTKIVIKHTKKIVHLLLFMLILILSEGCQNQKNSQFNLVIQQTLRKHQTELLKVGIQDKIRKIHSEELLKSRVDNNQIVEVKELKSFKGDAKFSQYIVQYLKTNNKNIDAEKFTKALMNLSQNQAYDPVFILAVAKTESGFDFNAVGSAGEIGLMQIKPVTAKWICNRLNIEWKGAQALKDPEYNILIGAYYFKYLKKTFKSQSLKYVNAYNMGLTMMKRMPAEALKSYPYLGKVTTNYLGIYTELNKIKEKI